jgi:MYXO-CTERM domain-containing protein
MDGSVENGDGGADGGTAGTSKSSGCGCYVVSGSNGTSREASLLALAGLALVVTRRRKK